MGDKPVIAIMSLKNPMVMAEFEPQSLLPLQMPKDMKTVECQKEDVAFDMECYVDSEGHTYDFGYGMNYAGVISDERTCKYVKLEWKKPYY